MTACQELAILDRVPAIVVFQSPDKQTIGVE